MYFHNKLIWSHKCEYYLLEMWSTLTGAHTIVAFFSGHVVIANKMCLLLCNIYCWKENCEIPDVRPCVKMWACISLAYDISVSLPYSWYIHLCLCLLGLGIYTGICHYVRHMQHSNSSFLAGGRSFKRPGIGKCCVRFWLCKGNTTCIWA